MGKVDLLNPLAKKMWTHLFSKYPGWNVHFNTRGGDDLEVAVPAPSGSNAGHLTIFTEGGRDTWVRFDPPFMCYAVEDEGEMISIIEYLLEESALFAVTMKDDSWTETALVRPEQELCLAAGHMAHVVSWTGKKDRIIRTA